ncbi:MAG: M56 family metallopeptidase [Pedobacter sp.]
MEAILNNLIRATGWSIFHSLWQGALMYGLVLLFVNAFPGLQSKTKHNLAYTSLLVMFVAFIATFVIIFELPGANEQSVISSGQGIGTQSGGYRFGWMTEMYHKTENVFPYLVSVYAVGLLIQLLVLSQGYLKLNILKKEGHEQVPESWQIIFKRLISKLGLHQDVKFRLSSMVNVPLVIGYLKPVVLFPVALVAQLDVNQVEAILIHELWHIRRNDYLLNLIKTAIETLLFFNPFVWLTSRLIDIEREHACDDLVLKLTGTPVTYAHALLKLEILKDKGSPALAMASTGKNHHLYQRIKRITDMKTNYMNSKQQLFAIVLTMATLISIAWVNPAKNREVSTITVKTNTFKFPKGARQNAALVKKLWVDTVPRKASIVDTAKKKRTIKIVTVDGKGKKVVYHSVAEMPDSLKLDVLSDYKFDFSFENTFKTLDSTVKTSMIYLKSPQFNKEMREATLLLSSPEFKKEMRETSEYIGSPEFKKELKKSAEATRIYLSSPEWKKQQSESIKSLQQKKKGLRSEELKAAQEQLLKNSKELRIQYSSPEFKKQIEALKELKSSKEYKQLKEKFDKDLESLKEKKGIKTDLRIGSLNSIDVNLSPISIF